MTLLHLYFLFAKIALFTFGGGYAMIPLFQDELVLRGQFLSEEEFANLVALAQMTPGPVGLNAATYIGQLQNGFWGSFFATLGVMTPSLILTMLVAFFLHRFKNNPVFQRILTGIRPAVLGVIASAVFFFANTSVFTAPIRNLWKGGDWGVSLGGSLIFAATLFVYWRYRPNLVWMLLAGGLAGVLLC